MCSQLSVQFRDVKRGRSCMIFNITYTQCEVLQIKRELHEYPQETSATPVIQPYHG